MMNESIEAAHDTLTLFIRRLLSIQQTNSNESQLQHVVNDNIDARGMS